MQHPNNFQAVWGALFNRNFPNTQGKMGRSLMPKKLIKSITTELKDLVLDQEKTKN